MKWLQCRPAEEAKFVIPDSWWTIGLAKGVRPKHHRVAARRIAELALATQAQWGWVKGHSWHRWNDAADGLANQGRLEAVRAGHEQHVSVPSVAGAFLVGGGESGRPPGSM